MVVWNWSSGVTGFNELRKSLTKQIGAKFGYFFFNSQCAIKMRGKERERDRERKKGCKPIVLWAKSSNNIYSRHGDAHIYHNNSTITGHNSHLYNLKFPRLWSEFFLCGVVWLGLVVLWNNQHLFFCFQLHNKRNKNRHTHTHTDTQIRVQQLYNMKKKINTKNSEKKNITI